MHHPSRRRFVAASLAGLPILAGGTASLFGSSFTLNAAEPRGLNSRPDAGVQSPPHSDPVLDAIVADFRELRREGDEKPGQRRGAVRGIETLTGVLAAHLGKHYDPEIKRLIRQARKNRQAFVHNVVTKANKPEFTHEKVDAMLTRLERDGLGGVFRDIQKGIRRMRDNMPPDYLQVRSATQYDFCADLRWMIELAEFASALACSLAVGFGGANAAADAACAGAGMALAGYLAMKWWYGC
jgi:hypothetical protein